MAENWLDRYAVTGLATIAGLHQLGTFARAVGKARGTYGVKAPATDGSPEFVRIFRAQQNTLEFYPMSLTALWIASGFFHPVPASVAYMGYLHGRRQYFNGYCEKTEKRTPGFYLSMKFLKAIFVMCLLGVGHKAVRYYSNVDLWELMSKNIPCLSN